MWLNFNIFRSSCIVVDCHIILYHARHVLYMYGHSRTSIFLTKLQYVTCTEDQRPYVPKSCCVKDRFWRYVNLDVCQKWRLGPPGSPIDGAINRAVYYDVSSWRNRRNARLFHLPLVAGLLRARRVMCFNLPLVAGLLRSGRAVHEGEHRSHDRTRYLNRIFTGQWILYFCISFSNFNTVRS